MVCCLRPVNYVSERRGVSRYANRVRVTLTDFSSPPMPTVFGIYHSGMSPSQFAQCGDDLLQLTESGAALQLLPLWAVSVSSRSVWGELLSVYALSGTVRHIGSIRLIGTALENMP